MLKDSVQGPCPIPMPGGCRGSVYKEVCGMSVRVWPVCRATGKRKALLSSRQSSSRETLYLVHHGGFLPVRFPVHSLVAVVDGIALHIHFGGQRLAALCYDGSYLLDFEQINL